MVNTVTRRGLIIAAAAGCASMLPAITAAQADPWPNRPVRILVPFPPGGGADFIARLFGQRLSELWRQPVVIDNKPGASTMIAAEAVAKAPPDGYTLLLTVSNHTSNPALFSKIPYDTQKDFTPITVIGSAPMVLVVNPGVPARNARELIALLREKPGKFSYGSAGNGSVGHLAGELLKQTAKVDMVHISYKGTAPAELDLMGGTIDLMFTGMVTAAPQIRAGKMRGIAVGSTTRSALLPELPTLDEAGVPGFESTIWYGLLGPAGLPAPVAAKVYADVARTLQEPEVKAKLLGQGAEPIGSSPEQFRSRIAAEITRFERLVKAAGIKSE
jgi:tripartite-type tricarboxylate transporter receptor subunit TctC